MIKDYLPHSLFGRAMLILVLPVLFVQLVTAYVFFDRHWDNVTKHTTSALAGEMTFAVARALSMSPHDRAAFLSEFDEVTDFESEFEDGKKLGALPRGQKLPQLESTLRNRLDLPLAVRKSPGGKQIRAYFQLRDGLLTLSVSVKRVESGSVNVLLMWMLGSAVIFVLIALLFLKNQIRPIARLAEAAEDFGKGKDMAGFRPHGAAEVRRAGKAFIVMRERIKRQMRTRTEMLSGISHDLRTPLARMKLQLEMMQGKEAEGLKKDVAQMQHMIDEYLQFARGESGEETAKAWSKDALEEALAPYGDSVTLTVKENVTVDVRKVAFTRLMHNLVDNALRHGKRCVVTADASPGNMEIYVDDDGPGIPPEEYESVFKPFTRLETSRNLNSNGVGLGLSIARDIVLSHGGTIFLTSSELGGLRVIVRIPR